MYELLLECPTTLTFKAAWLVPSTSKLSWLPEKEWSSEMNKSHQVSNTLSDLRTTENSSCISWPLERVLCRHPLVFVYISGTVTPKKRSPEVKTRHVSLSPNLKPQLCFIMYYFISWQGIILIQERLQWKCCYSTKVASCSHIKSLMDQL